MQRKKIIIPVIVIVALLVAVFTFFGGTQDRVNWAEHYRQSDDPYGTQVFKDYVKSRAGEFEQLNHSFRDGAWPDSGITYLFVGGSIFLSDADIDSMYEFIRAGNDVFIASSVMPEELLDFAAGEYCFTTSFFLDSIISMNLRHPKLVSETDYLVSYLIDHKPRLYEWVTVDTLEGCTHTYAALGVLNDYSTNFIRIKLGNGQLYYHTTPMAFTNYHLLDTANREYADKVLAHLNLQHVVWDEYHKTYRHSYDTSTSEFSESPLVYILSQRSLRWAWYLLLTMGLLYLIFKAKRRQRIIPVLAPNENTSLEFIHTIGTLYYQQNNHKNLANQKMKHFLTFVREHYGIATNELDESFIKRLAMKSQIGETEIQKIIDLHKSIQHLPSISEGMLHDLHEHIQKFYNKAK